MLVKALKDFLVPHLLPGTVERGLLGEVLGKQGPSVGV